VSAAGVVAVDGNAGGAGVAVAVNRGGAKHASASRVAITARVMEARVPSERPCSPAQCDHRDAGPIAPRRHGVSVYLAGNFREVPPLRVGFVLVT
jgi:hypothetical protein